MLLPLWFGVLCAAVLGLVLGSFAGLVVYRLPLMVMGRTDLSLSHPPSHCTACKQTLRWWHNLPVLSHVLLRGHCGFCGAPIGWQSLGLELTFGFLWACLTAALGPTPTTVSWAVFFSVLLVLLVIDWQTMLLPDALTWPLTAMGLLCSWAGWTGLNLTDSLLGAVLGYLMLFLPAWVFERWRGVTGMGGGDFKLMAALGAWLGPEALLPVLLMSSGLHVLLVLLQSRLPRWVGSRNDLPVTDEVGLSPEDALPSGAAPLGPALVVAAGVYWWVLR